MNLQTLFFLLALTTPITSLTTTSARIWTHFHPSCPNSSHPDMTAYETHSQTSHEFDIQSGTCQAISINQLKDSNIQNVDHVSVDAEIFWVQPWADTCNVTVHEVPGCVDPAVVGVQIETGLSSEKGDGQGGNRIGTSACAKRKFAPFEKVWVMLDCEERGKSGHGIGGETLHQVADYYRAGREQPKMGNIIDGGGARMRNRTTTGHVASVNGGSSGARVGAVAGSNGVSHSRPMEKTWKKVVRPIV